MRQDGRIGSERDGYVGQILSTRKSNNLRDWEWEDPDQETIAEAERDEDEEPKSLLARPAGGRSQSCSAEVKQSVKVKKEPVADSGGRGVGIAPRGKSWMIVTQRMMEEYKP